MTSEKALPQGARQQRPDHDLDRRYGEIGISAVAAAVRYCHQAKPAGEREVPKEGFGRGSGRAA